MQDAPLKPFRFADAARWIRAGVPVVMVTIVEVKGSAPREPGIPPQSWRLEARRVLSGPAENALQIRARIPSK